MANLGSLIHFSEKVSLDRNDSYKKEFYPLCSILGSFVWWNIYPNPAVNHILIQIRFWKKSKKCVWLKNIVKYKKKLKYYYNLKKLFSIVIYCKM